MVRQKKERTKKEELQKSKKRMEGKKRRPDVLVQSKLMNAKVRRGEALGKCDFLGCFWGVAVPCGAFLGSSIYFRWVKGADGV